MALTLGSLFDGIGVFPLAAELSGITPLWASEIEKVPISITRRHFPDMEHLGDITKLTGGDIPPVSVITFGSPCQDLSTIGAREGLSGGKSGLFYHAIRLIKEMRCATNGIYPAIAVWENVAGAFSSNDRMDFKSVLESFTDTEIPMPRSGRWANAGMAGGNGVFLCWRLMDARYWGEPAPPQRRKRIFIVADFRGRRSPEILFKSRCLQPHPHVWNAGRNKTAGDRGTSSFEAGRQIPVVLPFEERRMRSTAKAGNAKGFIGSFGRPDDPFPTLLAAGLTPFAYWYPGKEEDGVIRYVTPLEAERLMGLPEGWTALDCEGKHPSDMARLKALGNAIALPCAQHIMAGISEILEEQEN